MAKATRASGVRRARGRSRQERMSAPAAGGGKTPNSTSADSIRVKKCRGGRRMDSAHIPQPVGARAGRAAALPATRHLENLESEAIFILRETAAEFANPVLLFSGGKDSTVLLRLAEKAFRPGKFPFPLLHVDTGHNFPEVIEFRDRIAAELGERLIVRTVQDSIDRGRIRLKSVNQSRNALQSVTLLDAIAEFGFDACIGGARRDEEKARAKERIFSFRNSFGQWDPRHQRPELWSLY